MVLRQNLINQIEMAMVVQIILMVDFPYFRNMGDEWVEAHAYVINNCDEVIPFLEEYSQIRESIHPQQSFNDWFKDTVAKMYASSKESNIRDLLSLSRGPSQYATNFDGYIVNGYRFRIEDCDKRRRTQNYGVCVSSDVGNEGGPIDYYGILTEILELQYLGEKRVVLFKCKWFDVHDNVWGSKIDEFGFICINPQRCLRTNEPFILASQASQVFYAIDNANKNWHVVIKTQPRDSYNMSSQIDDDNENFDDLGEAYQEGESFKFQCGTTLNTTDGKNWARSDSLPITYDVSKSKKKRKR
ncbi:uncharacterized protein [Euphorbia lathyris]